MNVFANNIGKQLIKLIVLGFSLNVLLSLLHSLDAFKTVIFRCFQSFNLIRIELCYYINIQ